MVGRRLLWSECHRRLHCQIWSQCFILLWKGTLLPVTAQHLLPGPNQWHFIHRSPNILTMPGNTQMAGTVSQPHSYFALLLVQSTTNRSAPILSNREIPRPRVTTSAENVHSKFNYSHWSQYSLIFLNLKVLVMKRCNTMIRLAAYNTSYSEQLRIYSLRCSVYAVKPGLSGKMAQRI